MLNRCPNCSSKLSLKILLKGTHACDTCECLLGVRTTSEIYANGTWSALTVLLFDARLGIAHQPVYTIVLVLVLSNLLLNYFIGQPFVRVYPGLFCLSCSYNLRGLPESRCPECGTPFPDSVTDRIRQGLDIPAEKSNSGLRAILRALLLIAALNAGAVGFEYFSYFVPSLTIPASAPAK
jgi:hypothetical protein